MDVRLVSAALKNAVFLEMKRRFPTSLLYKIGSFNESVEIRLWGGAQEGGGE